ncbi:MAG: hypothetical protein ACFE91_15605, partial [Promethearchaeota archaeon]
MNKDKAKLIKILIFLSFLSIVVALIIDHSNFTKKQNISEQPEKVGKNILLSDGFQEADNLSTYQKFQEFWNGVYLQNASNWSYVNWREYIIMQIYGSSEEELNNTIKTDPLFEHNIDIFTVYVMGKFNGSLSEQDIINLKDQLIHNTVRIGDISFLKSNDDQLKISVNIEVESSPSMWYVADRLEIYLKSENSTGKWYN